MIEVRQTKTFAIWLGRLRDERGRARTVERIRRIERGNPGDVRPVGGGVSEMRVDFGPGYRVYFVRRGAVVILLLCGGDKSSQAADIKRAKALAQKDED